MKRFYIAFSALILMEILLLFIGCHSDGNGPTLPFIRPNSGETTTDNPVSIPKNSLPGDTAITPTLWGLYHVVYDPYNRTIEAVPVRGPAFAWNVVTFLQPPAGSINNMTLSVLDDSEFLTNGRMDVRVILHHPFPGKPTYTGFDVCGVFLTEGTIVSPGDSDISYANPAVDPTLLNPDGYTRWMNPTEFLSGDVLGYEPGIWGTSESSENSGFLAGATINPFKYFAQSLGPGQDLHEWISAPGNLDNRGMFPSGASCSRDYDLMFPIVGGKMVFVFNYAVLANWAPPTVDPPGNPITDFPIEANAQYPLHVFATDHSKVYYTPEDAGGTLSFDVEVFDWDVTLGNSSIPKEVRRFMVWSDNPLVPGGSFDLLSEEVEWNSGFTASTSTATVEIDNAVPVTDGDTHVWIAVESTHPSSYDQGFNADVPDDPVATYVQVPVNVKNCPKAFIDGMGTNIASAGATLNDVVIHGTGFADGEFLSVYMENPDSGGGSGSPPPTKIVGTDLKYMDNHTLTADFDLAGAAIGKYELGCVNGCGIETKPDENKTATNVQSFDVLPPTPKGMTISTNRTGPEPSAVSGLSLNWTPVDGVNYYQINVKAYDINETPTYDGALAATPYPYYHISFATLQLEGGGKLDISVTACATANDLTFESLPSTHAFFYYQSFEKSMGSWSTLQEESSGLRFIKSTVGAAYAGLWGMKTYGAVSTYLSTWVVLASPPIPEVQGASTVHYELVHRSQRLALENGYQIGWCNTLPVAGAASVTNYFPITEASYGFDYNDSDCLALQTEFGVTSSNDQNFQLYSDVYLGWYLSGFDASAILGNGEPDYLLVAMATHFGEVKDLNIDEVAILIY